MFQMEDFEFFLPGVRLTVVVVVVSSVFLLVLRQAEIEESRGQFNKSFTSVIYKCSYCLRV